MFLPRMAVPTSISHQHLRGVQCPRVRPAYGVITITLIGVPRSSFFAGMN